MSNDQIIYSVGIVTLLILLLVFGFVVFIYIAGKRSAQQKIEISEAKLAFERELRQVENEVSEQIMSQFAQELHDNIGQKLTAVHLEIEKQKIVQPSLTENLKPVEIYMAEISQDLRLLSRTLNHDYLGSIGLFTAIAMQVERLNNLNKLTIHLVNTTGPSGLEKNQELMVFRIFQEITQNVLRHAKASNLYITANTRNGFEMEIKDDGLGFDKEAVFASGRASGLKNMLKRAKLAGMSCEIQSEPGKGSLFILKKVGNLV